MRTPSLPTILPGLVLLVAGCGSTQETRDPSASAPSEVSVQEQQDERPSPEALRSARPAPMPTEEPAGSDAPADSGRSKVVASEPQEADSKRDLEAEAESSPGRVEPSRPPEPSAAPPAYE